MVELLNLQITSSDLQEFEETVEFYKGLLGDVSVQRDPSNPEGLSAAFCVSAKILLIAFKPELTNEANICPRRIWLRFKSETPDQVLQEARERGVFLPNDAVDAQSGGRGFFATDPNGIAIYIGTG